MTVVMSIEGIRGTSTLEGFEGWIQLTSFDWGGARGTQGGAGAIGTRANIATIAAAPQLRGVKVDRVSDHTTPEIWNLMLGMARKKVEIAWLRTGPEKLIRYLTVQLDRALITSIAEASNMAEPQETITFTYSKVTVTVTNVDDRLTGTQDIVTYDMPTTSLA